MIVAIADTHAMYWYLSNDKRLSPTANQFVENTVTNNQRIGVATISLVEIVYLSEKGRISPLAPQTVYHALQSPHSVLVEIPLTLAVVQTLQQVPWSDIPELPDRIIAATALHLNVPLISRDAKIQASQITTVW